MCVYRFSHYMLVPMNRAQRTVCFEDIEVLRVEPAFITEQI